MSDIPSEMTVIGISQPGGPDVLVPEKRSVPYPGEGELLVRVVSAGVNRPDVLQRQGTYPPPTGASDIPGLEIAGVVVLTGSGATRFRVGDHVMALVTGGGYSEFCLAHETQTLAVPDGLEMEQAGAIPETMFTVWHNVFERGLLKSGQVLLVHGGSSGIGTTAIQMAKAFGATVIATAGSDEKCQACLKLGADHVVNYRSKDFVAETKAVTGGNGADVILDMVAGEYVDRNYEAAAIEGRIVQIGVLQGAKVSANVARIMLKRLHHTGSTLRSRSIKDKAAMTAAIEEKLIPIIKLGKLKPLIDSTFPLRDAAKAHALMESSHHIGKIVLLA